MFFISDLHVIWPPVIGIIEIIKLHKLQIVHKALTPKSQKFALAIILEERISSFFPFFISPLYLVLIGLSSPVNLLHSSSIFF